MNNIEFEIINYSPLDENELVLKNRMIQFYRNSHNPTSRDNKIGHFTSSAFVVSPDYSKFLLIFHKKLGFWMQPGGHIENNETIKESALREAIEETGYLNLKILSNEIYDIDIHKIPAFNNEPSHYHYDIRYLFWAENLESNSKAEEQFEWFYFHQDLSHLNLEYSVEKMIKKFKLPKPATD